MIVLRKRELLANKHFVNDWLLLKRLLRMGKDV
jgi:hypothetical protein